MTTSTLTFEEIKAKYRDEWVLLGDPEMDGTKILSGTVLYHSKDKKEVCYIGRDKTSDYKTVTIAFAGEIKQQRRIGILRRL